MKERDEIEDLFSSAFSDFEKMPPPDLKSAIDERLFTIPEKKRKKGYIWIMSVVALLIGVLWFGYAYFDGSNQKEQLVISSSAFSDSTAKGSGSGQDGQRDKKSVIVDENGTATESKEKVKDGSNTLSVQGKERVHDANQSETVNASGRGKQKGGLKAKKGSKEKTTTDKNVNDQLSETVNEHPFNTPGVTEVNNPVNDVSDDNSAQGTESDKKDDVAVADAESKDTDTTQPEIKQDPTPQLPLAEDNSKKNWSLTLLAGPTYGLSKLDRPSSPEYFMKETVGFAASVESSFMLGQKWGVTTGLDFNTRTDIFYREVMDSTFIGQAYDYIYDTQVVDSVIDSVLVDVYENSGIVSEEQQRISHFSVAVPVYFTLAFPLSSKLNLELNGGMRFSYVSNKLSSNDFSLPVPTFKSVGIRATLRPQIIYRMDNGMGIGGYLNTGYDVIPAVQWESIKRSRIDLGGGILLRYSF